LGFAFARESARVVRAASNNTAQQNAAPGKAGRGVQRS